MNAQIIFLFLWTISSQTFGAELPALNNAMRANSVREKRIFNENEVIEKTFPTRKVKFDGTDLEIEFRGEYDSKIYNHEFKINFRLPHNYPFSKPEISWLDIALPKDIKKIIDGIRDKSGVSSQLIDMIHLINKELTIIFDNLSDREAEQLLRLKTAIKPVKIVPEHCNIKIVYLQHPTEKKTICALEVILCDELKQRIAVSNIGIESISGFVVSEIEPYIPCSVLQPLDQNKVLVLFPNIHGSIGISVRVGDIYLPTVKCTI